MGRSLNQDPIENLFGSVRTHGLRNTNPTCDQFIHSFKILLINNFTSIKRLGNCETDDCSTMLNNLKQFVKINNEECPNTNDYEGDIMTISLINEDQTITCNPILFFADMSIDYVTGYLAKSILKIVKNCDNCKKQLTNRTSKNPLIIVRTYIDCNLLQPTNYFSNFVKKMHTFI